MPHAVFLDRDGVLIRNEVRNGRPYAITDGEPVEIIEGVKEACASLSAAGFLLIMITNQPDVATGRTSRGFVESTNAYLAKELGLDDVQVCMHTDEAECACRKPKAGMILAAAAKFDIDLTGSIMVGDRWRDIEAGKRAGCRTILIDYGYLDRQAPPSDHVAASLFAAAEWIRGSHLKGQ
jgi:D-glycero-D-manno-heptose 1,7-bisphosphate phosphatase